MITPKRYSYKDYKDLKLHELLAIEEYFKSYDKESIIKLIGEEWSYCSIGMRSFCFDLMRGKWNRPPGKKRSEAITSRRNETIHWMVLYLHKGLGLKLGPDSKEGLEGIYTTAASIVGNKFGIDEGTALKIYQRMEAKMKKYGKSGEEEIKKLMEDDVVREFMKELVGK